jgi:hypothetical protein
MALSFGEDVAAVSLTWFASRHPVIAAVLVAIAVVVIAFSVRFVIRALRKLFRRARGALTGAPAT